MSEQLTWKPDENGRDTRWTGGAIRYTSAGKPTFLLERMVRGRRYLVSTRAHSVAAAMKHGGLPR